MRASDNCRILGHVWVYGINATGQRVRLRDKKRCQRCGLEASPSRRSARRYSNKHGEDIL